MAHAAVFFDVQSALAVFGAGRRFGDLRFDRLRSGDAGGHVSRRDLRRAHAAVRESRDSLRLPGDTLFHIQSNVRGDGRFSAGKQMAVAFLPSRQFRKRSGDLRCRASRRPVAHGNRLQPLAIVKLRTVELRPYHAPRRSRRHARSARLSNHSFQLLRQHYGHEQEVS